MAFLPNIKIGTRLALGFGFVIVAGLLGAGYGRTALSDVGREVRLLNEDRVVKVLLARDLRDNALLIAERARNVVMLSDAAAMAAEVKQIESIRAANGQLIERLDAIVTSEKGRALLHAAAQARSAFNRIVDQAVEAGLANRNEQARDLLLGEGQQAQQAYQQALRDLVDYQQQLMAAAKASAQAEVDTAGMVMVGVALLATLGGAFVAWMVAGSVTRPL